MDKLVTNSVAISGKYGYKITLSVSEYNDGLVLSCEGAPSGWYVNDLIKSFNDGAEFMYFDAGQGWKWENFRACMIELYLVGGI
jgi:hypothetical protein